jgi:hypothetical protein
LGGKTRYGGAAAPPHQEQCQDAHSGQGRGNGSLSGTKREWRRLQLARSISAAGREFFPFSEQPASGRTDSLVTGVPDGMRFTGNSLA